MIPVNLTFSLSTLWVYQMRNNMEELMLVLCKGIGLYLNFVCKEWFKSKRYYSGVHIDTTAPNARFKLLLLSTFKVEPSFLVFPPFSTLDHKSYS